MLTCQSNTLYWLCVGFGLITRAEIVLIILVLKNGHMMYQPCTMPFNYEEVLKLKETGYLTANF
jgi:hypothetical protein